MRVNRETVFACAKKILREPLLYPLPLLLIFILIAIPDSVEISNSKLTVDNKTSNITLPYLDNLGENREFFMSFNLSVKDNRSLKLHITPDDCIKEVSVNGKSYPLDGIEGLCDCSKGAHFDFSKYVQKGLNSFEFHMTNHGGPGGLKIELSAKERYERLFFVWCILVLFFVVLILRRLKLVESNRETVIACLLAFPFVIYASIKLYVKIKYALGAFEINDTCIYWAVGRGIVNGIAPWSGLWEIKPPGIFLLSAISFKIFDSPVFTNYFQAFVLLLTAAVPIAAYFLQSSYRSVSKLAFASIAGIMLALYSGERSGEVQVESFGAAFACIAVFAMATTDFEKRKILWTSIAVIGILGACGFKEPFLFPLFGVSLILCKNIKTWFFRFAVPLIISVLLGIVFLLIFGWMADFLHYLGYMSSTHISRLGSPFGRAMEFVRVYDDLNSFAWGFAIALLVLLSLPFVLLFANTKQIENTLLIKIVLFGAAFFGATYSVGVGGEFFGHHFVFALPLYMALVLLLLKNWNGENSAAGKLGLASFIFFAIAGLNYVPDPDYNGSRMHWDNVAKGSIQAAAYLDSRMDKMGVDRYAFIGGMGAPIYGWTKHSPKGPYFVYQDPFLSIPGYADSLVSVVKDADVIVIALQDPVVMQLQSYSIVMQRAGYIMNEHDFEVQHIETYKMYFRKNKTR